jgi:hypothetical protein
MTTLTKAEACALLFISESTMTRRLKAGRYTCTRTGTGKYDPVTFTHEQLGLTAPVAEVEPVSDSDTHGPVVLSTTRPEPEPEPDITAPDAFSPKEWTDSFGHSLTGNDRHVLFETQPTRTKFATDAHMEPGMQTSVTGAENPVDSDAYRDLIRAPGTPTVAERMAAMGRSSRSLTDAEKRRFVDRAAFRAGLKEGFSR